MKALTVRFGDAVAFGDTMLIPLVGSVACRLATSKWKPVCATGATA